MEIYAARRSEKEIEENIHLLVKAFMQILDDVAEEERRQKDIAKTPAMPTVARKCKP